MTKSFKIEDLDCAVCAARLESEIALVEGVKSASVSFIMQKLTLEAEDSVFDDVVKKVLKAAKRAEPDCRIVV